jgi:hypothetical protein
MRILLTIPMLCLVLISYPISADEIHMKDGSVVKGKITEVSLDSIKYTPPGRKKKILTIQRGGEVKIIYDDGETVDLAAISDAGAIKAVTEDKPVPAREPADKKLFIELESGWNGYAGTGVRLDYRLLNNISANAGAGYCRWGIHLRESLGLRYYWNYPFGFAFEIGASYNKGKSTVENLDVSRGLTKSNTEAVNIKYNSITTINISFIYSFKVGDSSKLYFEIGCATPLQDKSYSYTVPSGGRLTASQKVSLWWNSPGGVIISAGIGF